MARFHIADEYLLKSFAIPVVWLFHPSWVLSCSSLARMIWLCLRRCMGGVGGTWGDCASSSNDLADHLIPGSLASHHTGPENLRQRGIWQISPDRVWEQRRGGNYQQIASGNQNENFCRDTLAWCQSLAVFSGATSGIALYHQEYRGENFDVRVQGRSRDVDVVPHKARYRSFNNHPS